MPIYNKRFVFRPGKNDSRSTLDKVSGFLEDKLGREKFALRYAIVEVKKGSWVIEATILEEKT